MIMKKEFKIKQLFFTENNCFKTGRKMKPKGIMSHSTGANNPYLSRYVGPDDGILGLNKYGNHWNQAKPDGRSVCVHAWIGYIKDKKGIATYQSLPWDHVGWHSGVGPKGSANTQGYISYEICEDGLDNRAYFDEVYNEAINLNVYLCRLYDIPVNNKTIIDHSEGRGLGIASNHGDVKHWFSRFGKTMDDFRNDIAKRLKEVEIVAKLENWQKKQGEEAINSLAKKKDNEGNPIVGSPDKWKKALGEDVPQWLFWSIIDRISK